MLRRLSTSVLTFKRQMSALYVTGDKAMENYAVLSPYLIFKERMNDFEEIKENLRKRKLKMDLKSLKDEYDMFKAINEKKEAIERRRAEIATLVRKDPNEGLKTQAKHLRDDLKQLKENSYYLEDQFVNNYLKLPNFLHESVPEDERKIIYSFKDSSEVYEKKNREELMEFYDSTCYYLKGEAAKFDTFMPLHVMRFYQENGFVPFSNPDFVRSVIAEGAGEDPNELFLLKEDGIENKLNLLHLTGNASFLSYLPFITKLSTFQTMLPQKFISTGRQYDSTKFHQQNLFDVVQTTCCQTFIATADGSTFANVISEQIDHFIKVFEPFGHHFRIVYCPAHQLKPAESCKIAVEMFSPSQKNYVEVGNFSYYNDFVSKRLLFNYKIGKDFHFPHVYSGTAVNVLKLILVLIECEEEFKCPSWLE